MNQYKTFWDWLESNSSKIESFINNGQSKSVEELISRELGRINPNISWEISTNKNNVHKDDCDMKFIPFLLLFVLLLAMWLLPSATSALGIALILISLSLAFFSIFRKHHTTYLQGKLTRMAFLRNTFLDMFGILLAIVLAGLLGRYVVGLATQQINNDTARLIAGILIGLLVGIGIGVFVNRAWGRFVKTSSAR